MHMKGEGRGPGTSRNLKVMVKLNLVSIELIQMVKKKVISLQLVFFLIHLVMLIEF